MLACCTRFSAALVCLSLYMAAYLPFEGERRKKISQVGSSMGKHNIRYKPIWEETRRNSIRKL